MNKRRFFIYFAAVASYFLITISAFAHDARPLFIDIKEAGAGAVYMTWRTPASVDEGQAPIIELPGCEALAGQPPAHKLQGVASYHCPAGLSETKISVQYPLYNPSISTLIRVTFSNGETHSAALDPSVREWRIPPKESFSGAAKSYFRIGVIHILGGVDHLLFLIGLLYIARTPRRILTAVTGFTIAHSLTIFLVALNILRVSVPAVETVIALSIVFLASEIARNNHETFTWRRPIFVAGAFGLVHGAGFAAALSEIGLPQTEKISALLFFNIGVEAGQLVFVLIVFLIAYLAAHKIKSLPIKMTAMQFQTALGYALGGISAFWFIKRLAYALA